MFKKFALKLNVPGSIAVLKLRDIPCLSPKILTPGRGSKLFVLSRVGQRDSIQSSLAEHQPQPCSGDSWSDGAIAAA